jgi:transcription-repair coupling factor (superfamily II helicase)
LPDLTETLLSLLEAGRTQPLHRMPAPATAFVAWLAAALHRRSVVLITEGPHALETGHQDLATLAGAMGSALGLARTALPELLYYPAREALPDEQQQDTEIAGMRLDALLQWQTAVNANRPAMLVTCIQALLQRAPDPAQLEAHTTEIAVGATLEPNALAQRLQSVGYEPVPEVQSKGEFAVRGGLLDVWPVNAAWPARLEFVGATIESLRVFDPATQRSTARPTSLRISPAREPVAPTGATSPGWLANLPTGTLVVWTDLDAIGEHATLAERHASDNAPNVAATTFASIHHVLNAQPTLAQWAFETAPPTTAVRLDFAGVPDVFDMTDGTLHPDARLEDRQRRWQAIRTDLHAGWRVLAFCDTAGTLEHFLGEFKDPPKGLRASVGALTEGFRCESLRLSVLAESNLFGQRKQRARAYEPQARAARPSRDRGDRVADLATLKPGDLVVHVEHGLGRFLGVTEIMVDDQPQEVITLEYDEGAKLHVPVAHAHLLSRYVGLARTRPKLHRLGGRRWTREKQDAERAIADMAAALLETQAQRDLLEGVPHPPDTPWQREFEASFPFEETPDQATAIADVKRDLENTRPMDRLICGDAGYGKTEVAMRAAFKAVAGGRQVAVLVPTTVLAQQHYQTFAERMAPYPIRIEVLSRFSRSRQSDILQGLADGTIDIVIGTHALIQPAVRFRNLGLAIVDEEQRFGVAHKERLKQIRRLVDVLTLTATPIPRTLYLSLTGSRDMSLLQTPPRQRMAIETLAVRNTDDVVRTAIRRELDRDGQVFYLHNRIMTIERVRERLRHLVPEARVAVGHGQMGAAELKAVMRQFVNGEFDVLLCTTIIESGVDIPRANTILIDRADRFGIADLYQLRGRVGRSSHKAYAILLLPPHGLVETDARKRLDAVQRHTALGAGFSLALQDLEIRGSGNLLGAQQSGHIAAVGFGLYCQLLRRTVAHLRGQAPPPVIDVDVQFDFLVMSPRHEKKDHCACIPHRYLPAEPQRLELYRRLAQLAEPAEVDALRDELTDRFGPPPKPVQLLLHIAQIRLEAYAHRITSVRVRDGKIILSRRGDVLMDNQQFPRLHARTATARLAEVLERVRTVDHWGEV